MLPNRWCLAGTESAGAHLVDQLITAVLARTKVYPAGYNDDVEAVWIPLEYPRLVQT